MSGHYVPFTLDQFRAVMDSIGFKMITAPPGTLEYLFERQVETKGGTKFSYAVRIYSSIDMRTHATRDTGKDAIRLVLMKMDDYTQGIARGNRPIRVERRVHRTQGAFENVKERARELFKYVIQNRCPSCPTGLLVERKGSRGTFRGCTNYPECKQTQDVQPVKPKEVATHA